MCLCLLIGGSLGEEYSWHRSAYSLVGRLLVLSNKWRRWQGDFLSSLILTLFLVIIGFNIFLENRDPIETITWLVIFGAFPFIGFIFYFLFGRNFRKERIFRKKYFLDKQSFVKISGEAEYNDRIKEMGENPQQLITLANRLGNSPISFTTETRV